MKAIKRDGKLLAVVEPAAVMEWFHKNTNGSMNWALRYGAYSVVDWDGAEQPSSSGA